MPCDVETILGGVGELENTFSEGWLPYLILARLCALRNGDSMSCDPDALLEDARCLMCKISPGVVLYAQLAVLCEITGGGGGGSQLVEYVGVGPPVAAPADPTQPAVAYSQDGSGSNYNWNTNLQIWV